MITGSKLLGYFARRELFFAGRSFPRRFAQESFEVSREESQSTIRAPSFKKNFASDFLKIVPRTAEEIAEWRKANNIRVSRELQSGQQNEAIPSPLLTFDEVNLPSDIRARLAEANIQNPTEIQAEGWSIALKGHDLIGIAKTGSGKTLAFLLPALVHLEAQTPPKRDEGPIALILAPTRELAMQITSECSKFSRRSLRVASVYGGVPKDLQRRGLSRGVDVLVATPGRLLDYMSDGTIALERVTYLVLDEADRMLDMGFQDQIEDIVKKIRPDRQTLFWSATWPMEVMKLARALCNEDPVKIQVGSEDVALNDQIKQTIELMKEEEKKTRLLKLLSEVGKGDKVLVFCARKHECENLTNYLSDNAIKADFIHGDLTQRQRDQRMNNFRRGDSPLLIATDLAARGLDVKDVRLVVNYDMPENIEDYVHRVGRTGRAGATGNSVSFFTTRNQRIAKDLISVLEKTKQEVPAELQWMQRSSSGDNSRRRDYSRERGSFARNKDSGFRPRKQFGEGGSGFGSGNYRTERQTRYFSTFAGRFAGLPTAFREGLPTFSS